MDESRIMNVAIGELASHRGVPVGAPKNLSLLFAVAVGLVSGIGGAFLREFFDSSIKTEGEMRSAVDLPVLGTIGEERNGKSNGKNGNGNGKNGNGHGKNGNGKGGNGYH
jgi:capsular polysaccharide biosynthesis protein